MRVRHYEPTACRTWGMGAAGNDEHPRRDNSRSGGRAVSAATATRGVLVHRRRRESDAEAVKRQR
jgi:hypothetical protein